MKIDQERSNGLSILCLAFLSNNKTLFSALLFYGANPSTPFAIKNGIIFNAILFMMVENCTDDFYLEKLIEYGLNFNNLNNAITAKQAKASVAAMPNPMLRKQINQLHIIQDILSTLGYQNASGFNHDSLRQTAADVCPFIRENASKNSDSQPISPLYVYCSKHCSLASLLLSAAIIIQRKDLQLNTIPSNISKLILIASGSPQQNDIENMTCLQTLSSGNGKHKNFSHVIDIYLTSQEMKLKTIIDQINARFSAPLSESVFNSALFDILKMQSHGDVYTSKSCIYLATNLLYGLKGSLSEKETALYIQNLFKIALSKLEEFKINGQAFNVALKMPQNKERIAALIQDFAAYNSRYMTQTFECFRSVIQTAYFAEYISNIDLPEVKASFAEMDKIVANSKFLPQDKARIMPQHLTPAQWLERRNAMLAVKQTTQSPTEEMQSKTPSFSPRNH